jgi:hypothetical protein
MISFKRNHELPFQSLEEEAVVVNPKTREVHVLNGTGARIWELLGTEHTLDELVHALEEEFEPGEEAKADPSTLRREVATFVRDLARCQLVNETPAAARR